MNPQMSASDTQIRNTQERYRLLVEQTPDGILLADDDWNITFANEAACRMSGYTPEEIVHLNSETTYLSEERNLIARRKQQMRVGESARYERFVVRKDGTRFLAEVIVRRLEQGGLQTIFRDITERKQAEETRLRLAAIVESSLDPIVSTNLDGLITSWNAAAEHLYGYTADEIMGKPINQILPIERHPEKDDVLRRVTNGEHVGLFESVCVAKDGHRIPVSLTVSPLQDASTNIVGTSAVIHDITERKRSEDQLRLQSAALEAAANAIVITDTHGIVLWVNPAFTTLTGWSRGEVIGSTLRTLKSGKHDSSFYRELWETITAGRVWHGEMVNRRKDGSLYTEEMTITPVRDAIGAISRFIAIKQDITERKQAEEALQKSEEQYRALVETTDTGFVILDPNGRVLDANAEYVRLTGHRDLDEIRGRSVVEWTAGAEQEENAKAVRTCLKTGHIRNLEIGHVDSHGKVTPIEINATVEKTRGAVRIVALCRDITKRRQAEEERARLFEQLQASRERSRRLAQQAISASEEERRRLSRELHDEAGQMFTVLKVKLGLLCQKLSPEDAALRERLEELMALTDTTGNQIREVARSLRPPVLDTLGLGGGLEELCREFAQLSGLIIDYRGVETPSLSEATMTCSYRVVQEALTNVAKHAQAKRVEVRLAVDDGQLCLSVTDDGKGYDATASQNGLGLEGMRERVDLLGGQLDIKVEPGQGTRLVVRIPYEEPR
jgi:PAS domain S-box-containing protein